MLPAMYHRQADALRSRASEGRIGISLYASPGRQKGHPHIFQFLKRGKIKRRRECQIHYLLCCILTLIKFAVERFPRTRDSSRVNARQTFKTDEYAASKSPEFTVLNQRAIRPRGTRIHQSQSRHNRIGRIQEEGRLPARIAI